MLKTTLGITLAFASLSVGAACRSLEGNWIMQTTLIPSALESAGIYFSSSLLYLTVTGSEVTVRKGTSMVLSTDGPAGLGVVAGGGGTVVTNPVTCRLRFDLTTQVTTYISDGQQTRSTQGTSTLRGRGDYVKLNKGFAGRFVRTASGVSVPGRFEIAPE